ncbi:MAG: AI-2E family transporter [Eggerthellaceae bacterium]|nr:AI-2E family transporter [Eggerthellaceae bacterium]
MKNITWKTCARLGATALIVYLCIRYWGGIESFLAILLNGVTAILAGIIIAYVVNIPMRFFERVLPGETGDGTRNRVFSLLLAIVCIVIVALFVILLIVPALVDAVITLAHDLPGIINTIVSSDFVKTVLPASILDKVSGIDWGQIVGSIATWLQSGITSILPGIASFLGVAAAWIVGILFAFWYLAEKDKLSTQCHRMVRSYLSPALDEKMTRLLGIIDDRFHRFIVAQSLEALIFGTIITVVALLLGLPYATMLGVLIGVMSLIPMYGAYIGAIFGAFIILATSWQQALVFLIAFIVVAQVESNFVYNRVVGRRVGLTGMWPFIGVTLGTVLFGIPGAFVGVPIMSVIFQIVHEDLTKRESLPKDALTPLERVQQKLSD